jgi:hypothetical protein
MTEPKTKPKPKAPSTLQAGGRALWRQIAGGPYELRPDELRTLADACHEADLVDALQADVHAMAAARDFRTTGSQGQQVIAPEVQELRQHRALLSSLLAKLKLPDDGAVADGASGAGRALAGARWGKAG